MQITLHSLQTVFAVCVWIECINAILTFSHESVPRSMFVPFEDKCKSPLLFSTFPRALKLSNCVESASDISRGLLPHLFDFFFWYETSFMNVMHILPGTYFGKCVNVDD